MSRCRIIAFCKIRSSLFGHCLMHLTMSIFNSVVTTFEIILFNGDPYRDLFYLFSSRIGRGMLFAMVVVFAASRFQLSPLVSIRIVYYTTCTNQTKRHCSQLPPDCGGSHDIKVTKSWIMQHMIKREHVPIKSTTFRKMMSIDERKGRLGSILGWDQFTRS